MNEENVIYDNEDKFMDNLLMNEEIQLPTFGKRMSSYSGVSFNAI